MGAIEDGSGLGVELVYRELEDQPTTHVELEYTTPSTYLGLKKGYKGSVVYPVATPTFALEPNIALFRCDDEISEEEALEIVRDLAEAEAEREIEPPESLKPNTPTQKIKVRIGAPRYGCEVNLNDVVRAVHHLGFSIQGVTPDEPYNGVDSWKVQMAGKFEVEEIEDEG